MAKVKNLVINSCSGVLIVSAVVVPTVVNIAVLLVGSGEASLTNCFFAKALGMETVTKHQTTEHLQGQMESPVHDGMNSTLNSVVSKLPTATVEEESGHKDGKNQDALFFNYHEFSVTEYMDINGGSYEQHEEARALCITHFPNVYVPMESPEFDSTRVVRIARRFEGSLDYPCFSTEMPGFEPAALTDPSENTFTPRGIYHSQLFGYTSISPLSNYIPPERFQEIVCEVNRYLQEAYTYSSWTNVINRALDMVTLTMWSTLVRKLFRNPLLELEDYISDINSTEAFEKQSIKLISPRRSGYLSVCMDKRLQGIRGCFNFRIYY